MSALGGDADTTFSALFGGRRGFGELSLFDTRGLASRWAAEVSPWLPTDVPKTNTSWSRCDRMALRAAREALVHAGLDPPPDDMALAFGTSAGGMFEAESVLRAVGNSELSDEAAGRLLSYPLSVTANQLRQSLGLCAGAATFCSACSSGGVAITQAHDWLCENRVPFVLAGAADALCELTFTGFQALGIMSSEPCRPFDVHRTGLSLGEGAGFLVLETEHTASARGANVLAWLAGCAIAAEAHHLTQPEPTGTPAAKLIERALSEARLLPSDIDYVNAHGTGTPKNDRAEARALTDSLRSEVSRIFVSSSKGQLGHTLGAAGAIEAVIAVMALRHRKVPPTGGLTEPDPELGLRHVVERGIEHPLRAVLSNSFGFGGTGSVLVLERPDAPARDAPALRTPRVFVSAVAHDLDEAGSRLDQPLEHLDPARSRRFDRRTALLAVTAAPLAERIRERAELAVVLGSVFDNVERTVAFLRRIAGRGARYAAPAEFPHLVPSSPSGNLSIYFRAGGPAFNLSSLDETGEQALSCAYELLRARRCRAALAGAASARDAVVEQVLGPLYSRGGRLKESAAMMLLGIEPERGNGPLRCVCIRFASLPGARLQTVFLQVPGPKHPARARLMLHGDSTLELPEAWSRVPRLAAAEPVWHSAKGALALARAVNEIRDGEADEVFVIGGGEYGCAVLLELSPKDATD